MSFRGGRGGGRGAGRGGNRGGFRGGRGGGRPGSDRKFDQGPPEEVVEFGVFSHECEGQLVVNATIEKIPYFNAPIYLKDIAKGPLGKVDEILGQIHSYTVSVQLNDNYKASSFEKKQPLYIDPRKLLPLERFLPKEPVPKEKTKKRKSNDAGGDGNFKKFRDDRGGASGRGRGGFSSGRGGFSSGRGGGFSSGRGGFSSGGNRGGSFGGGGFRGGRGAGRGGSFRGGSGRGGGRF